MITDDDIVEPVESVVSALIVEADVVATDASEGENSLLFFSDGSIAGQSSSSLLSAAK
jgi:hypothetical protein